MNDLGARIVRTCRDLGAALASLPARQCERIQAERYAELRAAGERRRDTLLQAEAER